MFRSIVGFEGLYSVSSDGAIRNDQTGRILRSTVSTNGYRHVALYRDKKRIDRTVHSLVAEAFLGPRPPGQEVNHRNGDRLNNGVGNVEWKTPSGNMAHAYATGLKVSLKGEAHPKARLTDADVRAIRQSPSTQRALAALYGVSRQAIGDVVNNRVWKHVI